MTKIATLKIVDSYHDIFTVLSDSVKPSINDLDGKNLVFLEEKTSLMAERHLFLKHGGSFNTEVTSFGKFLRSRKKFDNLLTKEGCTMALKKIINGVNLKCFSLSKSSLAPSLYDLIIQLKSASLTIDDVMDASYNTQGILKNKLSDVCTVFSEYESFMENNGFIDQSTALSYLPDIIKNDDAIKGANVYLVGYVGWTAQARQIVSSILKTAKSVTAILPDGENKQIFVGETVEMFRRLCKENDITLLEEHVKSSRSSEAEVIVNTLFSPDAYLKEQFKTDKIYVSESINIYREVVGIAQIIKASVMKKGQRYFDMTVAVPDVEAYSNTIKKVFSDFEIPYYVDEQKSVASHPMVNLINSYVELFRKNFDKKSLCAFIKNPLFLDDKNFADKLENYIIKYNVSFDKIKTAFTEEGIDLSRANLVRERIVDLCKTFDVLGLIEKLNVKEKLDSFTPFLNRQNRTDLVSVNDQIYDAIFDVLTQMRVILGGVKLSYKEFKDVFNSGVSALKLSIIPQYTDAVFVGAFKEVALSQSKNLFILGLTASVPGVKEDVAVLTDAELDTLKDLKLLIEPKISIVNKRSYENAGLLLSSFKDRLFLSYPVVDGGGEAQVKSELISFVENNFTVRKLNYTDDYLTLKQGFLNFSKNCGKYLDYKINETKDILDFYKTVTDSNEYLTAIGGKEVLDEIISSSKEDLKIRLLDNQNTLPFSTISPTTIESFYSCPYMAFAQKTLKIVPREEGEVNALSVGNVAHATFEKFIEEIGNGSDFEKAFNNAKEKVCLDPEFSRFLSDVETKAILDRVFEESKVLCEKIKDNLSVSEFVPTGVEVKFGDGGKYPALSLLDGKYKVKGKIDRIDEADDYFRIMDYKTGRYNDETKSLFVGESMQLYLYAKVCGDATGKKPAGLYYLPVDEGYKSENKDPNKFELKGKTVSDESALIKQDKGFNSSYRSLGVYKSSTGISGGVDQATMDAMVDYAVKMCENATKQMASGVIVASAYEDKCNICSFKGMCGQYKKYNRKVDSVPDTVILDAVRKEGDDGSA